MSIKKALMVSTIVTTIYKFNWANLMMLKDMGFEVHVACSFDYDECSIVPKEYIDECRIRFVDAGFIIHEISFSRNPQSKSNLKAYKQLRTLFKSTSFELIHVHTPIAAAICRLTARNTRKHGTKLLYTAHGFHFYKGAPKKNWLMFYPVEKLLARFTDALVTINNEDFEVAQKFRLAKDGKAYLIPGVGIDTSRFTVPSPEEKSERRKLMGYTDNDFILFFAGEISPGKNQRMLVSVIQQLIPQIPEIKLLLAGKGEDEALIKNMITERNLEGSISLLGFRSDIPELLSISDVAVSPSRREGLPVNIIEAMAAGLPQVATDCRGNRDLIISGKTGFITPLDGIDEFANGVLTIRNDPALREHMGSTAHNAVEAYSLKSAVNAMMDIYSSFT